MADVVGAEHGGDAQACCQQPCQGALAGSTGSRQQHCHAAALLLNAAGTMLEFSLRGLTDLLQQQCHAAVLLLSAAGTMLGFSIRFFAHLFQQQCHAAEHCSSMQHCHSSRCD